MPTYLVKDTYATISAAITAIPANLSGTGVHEVIVEKSTYNEAVSITGFSNYSSSDYIYVHAKSGDEHKGIFDSGVIINSSSSVVYIETSYNRFKNIQITHTGAGGGFYLKTVNATYNVFENILVKETNGGTGFYVDDPTDPNYLYKCVFWDVNNTANQGTGTGGSIEPVYAKNCLSYGFNYGLGGYLERKNCVAVNARTQDYGNTGFGTEEYNVSTDGSHRGSNGFTATLEQLAFKDSTNGNFHISLNSALKGAGTQQTTYFSQDIDLEGIDINDWPIGPDYPIPTCWTYTARYKNSKRLFRIGGPDKYPKFLRLPSNIDISTGRMIDEGELIDPDKYIIQ